MRTKNIFSTSFYFAGIGFILFTMVLILAGCDSLMSAPAATQPPDSTEQIVTASPTVEAQPVLPTLTPTATPVLLPTSIGSGSAESSASGSAAQEGAMVVGSEEEVPGVDFGTAAINILRPGELSQLASPILLRANLLTGDDLNLLITLYGEDGRVLDSKNFKAKPYSDPFYGNVITELEFDIPIQAEAGRLELKVNDRFGRLKALNSVNLILLSSDLPSDRNYAPEGTDRIFMQLPDPNQKEITGSPLLITGLVRTKSDRPLEVWLEDEKGNRVGQGTASVVLTPGSDYSQFIGEINYQVSEPTSVLMIMALSDSRIRGYTYVKSIDLLLIP